MRNVRSCQHSTQYLTVVQILPTFPTSSLMLLCGVDASFMQKCYVFITYMMGDGGCLKLTKVLLLTRTMVEWDCLLIEGNISIIGHYFLLATIELNLGTLLHTVLSVCK